MSIIIVDLVAIFFSALAGWAVGEYGYGAPPFGQLFKFLKRAIKKCKKKQN